MPFSLLLQPLCGLLVALALPPRPAEATGAASPARPGPPAGLRLRVEPVFGSQPLVLETQTYPTAHNGAVSLSTCRFYLSALRLTFTDGSSYAEPASYHLIDAADTATFSLTLPQAPGKAIKMLTFSVGVDSAANVAGAQGGDLEPGRGMYWAWHSGYVNAKLEGRSPACPGPRHEFEWHVGGYQRPCASLRRVTLPVPPGHPATAPLRVLADVGQWLSTRRLAETASVLVPGPAAQALADGYATMFRLAPATQP
ncbi:hypothetical protein SAMN02745146_0547 [Hymenobacter daecheongensis DSM 21074]|uniref:Copper-binding protein MbnP-like domain-containing protein n=1 Tax=Hymenobacter daecheongensis DSM 21074 TaxID=1121955 RepID=A0A1M6A8R8_9BACT|nr:MbnP family protein [Hymenobacter daecheongensis]SHI32850.1 hypothetical protein SAMN02745146_0547 [Hymenobacter daecheongensis DSM 21074]